VTGIVAAVVITAGLVAEATGGRIAAGRADAVFDAVSIDGRTVGANDLFVALKGERFDGHDYTDQAQARGATGLLVSRPATPAGTNTVIEVEDTLLALQSLARVIRRRSGATVIAITGSAGKTSTKEITADLLATRFRVFRNRGNLNNHIGLPLSLTGLAAGPEVAVVELGMNHAGEIRELIGIAEPEIRVWTNVGDAHIGYFETRQAVATAKAEILERSTTSTVAILNDDDPLVMSHVRGFPGRVVTFGTGHGADVRAVRIVDRGFEGTTATVRSKAGEFVLELTLPGRAQLMNVLAGAAVALEHGIEPAAIVAAAGRARPVPRRGAMMRLPNGARLVDDTYNASPAAMQAMLAALAATPGAARRIAVLGEMRELGDQARALHEECGRAAHAAGADMIVAVGGAPADGLVDGAVAAGFPVSRALRFKDSASAAGPVAALVQPGDLVLVKGSRGTRMDVVADALAGAERQG
jgi:UDP-N-acetylmuramoyl-tripeptide--D-alanyl-D-alanine ligase